MTTSWIIIRLADEKVIAETYNPAVVEALNADKYKTVPILEYLQNLNRDLRDARIETAGTITDGKVEFHPVDTEKQ